MHITMIDVLAGTARVLSNDGTTWYATRVDVDADGEPLYTCTCPAGGHDFGGCRRLGYCKHVAAVMARLVHFRAMPVYAAPGLHYSKQVGYCARCARYAPEVVIAYDTTPDTRHAVHICSNGHRAEIDLAYDVA